VRRPGQAHPQACGSAAISRRGRAFQEFAAIEEEEEILPFTAPFDPSHRKAREQFLGPPRGAVCATAARLGSQANRAAIGTMDDSIEGKLQV
jgi:hypothetical protein